MDKKDLVWIILISVILLVLVSLTIPILVQTPHPGPGPIQQPQSQGQDESRHIKTAISFINIGLIVPLFVIYTGIYRRMRSSFTLGLIAVIFALGMYAVTSCQLIVSLLGGRAGDIGLFQIIPDLCTTVALIILIRISLE
jgi:tellurite resistance protein TehA-like permease